MIATPLEQSTPSAGAGYTLALEEGLRREGHLLGELLRVLANQRSGVAGDDLTAVDDSVFAAQRILLTLSEARRQRRSLLSLLAGHEDVPLGELDTALGKTMTDGIRAARDGLLDAARRLAGELERNRRILAGALDSGDRLIRALRGEPATPTVYGTATSSEGSGGVPLIDRQA